MTATITVFHENVDDATFDLDYCMTKHMSLVNEKFKPFGVKGWRVLKAVRTPFRSKPACSIIANLESDTADQFRAAVAAASGPVFCNLVGAAPKALRLTAAQVPKRNNDRRVQARTPSGLNRRPTPVRGASWDMALLPRTPR